MTERFKLFVGKNYGVQKVDGEVIFDSIISMAEADVLVDLLNGLTEENEQLKKEKDYYKRELQKDLVCQATIDGRKKMTEKMIIFR